MAASRQVRGLMIALIPLLIVSCSKSAIPPATPVVSAITPSEIFDKVTASYKSMETYKSEGTITSNVDTGGTKITIETSFSILLKKPNFYLISWKQEYNSMPGMAQPGAVWSDGTQPYLYMGAMNAYSKISNDELALGAATGISGGAALTIPALFLSVFKEQPAPFSRLINPKIEKSKKVGEEECYVISGSSPISKKEAYWISKTSYLIKKYERSFEPPEGGMAMPEITDEQIEEAIRGMGEKVTPEGKQKMKKMMEESMNVLKTTTLKGSSIEIHANISTPELSTKDFRFKPPKDSVLKDSLFGNVLGSDN